MRQLLAAAQEQVAAGDFEGARATLASISTLGSVSQQEASLILYLSGQVSYEQGQVGRAVSAWRQALAIGGLPEAQQLALEAALARLAERAAPAGTPSSPQALLQAADQASQFGRSEEAETYYDAAIKGFAAEGNATGLARAHYEFGNHLATTRRDLEGALGQHVIAVEHAELSGERSLLLSVLGAIGRAAIVAGRAEDGRVAFERLLGLLGDEDGALRAGALAGLGEASLRLKDWPAAVEAYEQWLAVTDTSEDPEAQRMLHSYVLALRLAGRVDDALSIIARLDAMAQSEDERRRLALQLEQDGVRARGLEHAAAGCWFDARAQERYVALGRDEDADILEAVMDAERCSEASID
ncbi:MAG TPA: hypothetical protein VMR74_14370 [Gammaproteobacteria bacterium]|nr:hypothetical protein [Gammaproteobacteria bacterium]